MKRFFFLLFIVVACQKSSPFSDVAVAIDPGHGGTDSGHSEKMGGKLFCEASVNYDVALRLHKILGDSGAVRGMTVKSKRGIQYLPPNTPLPCDLNAHFPIEEGMRRPAIGHIYGLLTRNVEGRVFDSTFRDKDRYWISIHFDYRASNKPSKSDSLDCGVRIFYPEGAFAFAKALGESFAEKNLLRKIDPVVPNGRKMFKEDNAIDEELVVLHFDNPIRQKVMIELGNVVCPDDREKILSPFWRQVYALLIARGVRSAHLQNGSG